jgi:fructose-1,6-bisphosphatase I
VERLGTTLTQHIRHHERRHPGATGEFSMLLGELALAAKVISREVNRAGVLEEVLGLTGQVNVQGEEVQKLDHYANETLVRVLGRSGHVAALASEEVAEPIALPEDAPRGRYVVLFDPLDGSSNIDVNVSIGTIFSIHRRRGDDGPAGLDELLRPGSEQVAAGYVIYGSSTLLVYTARNGVHGFTLDPTVGEFLLSHEDLRIPGHGSFYSVNEGNACRWSRRQAAYVDWLKQEDRASGRPYKSRYVGSLVADFHRTLLTGGIFMYPEDSKSPSGKLRYLYEAAPLALVCEEAGGSASDGRRPILERRPETLHERTPLFIGSRDDVAAAEGFLAAGVAPGRAG